MKKLTPEDLLIWFGATARVARLCAIHNQTGGGSPVLVDWINEAVAEVAELDRLGYSKRADQYFWSIGQPHLTAINGSGALKVCRDYVEKVQKVGR